MAIGAGPMFKFNEAISLLIECSSQEEIDYFWSKLSTVPDAEACGWCKDKYGLSWQVWSREIGEMLSNGDDEATARMQPILWKMKKIDIAELRKAYNGGK